MYMYVLLISACLAPDQDSPTRKTTVGFQNPIWTNVAPGPGRKGNSKRNSNPVLRPLGSNPL